MNTPSRATRVRRQRTAGSAVILALLLSLFGAAAALAGESGVGVTVLKVDPAGMPLDGACFVLAAAPFPGPSDEEACDDGNDGTIVFGDVEPGVYNLFETLPPEGYMPGEPELVTVNEADVEVTVVNQPFQAQLFLSKQNCTAAEQPSLHVQVFGFDTPPMTPPDVGLEEGICAGGRGTFHITGGDLNGPLVLQATLPFGFAQTTLDPGSYQIAEISPNQTAAVPFTVVDAFSFVDVLAINPLTLPTGPAGPAGPPGPPGPAAPRGAVAGGTGGPGALPNTAVRAAAAEDGLVWPIIAASAALAGSVIIRGRSHTIGRS